MQRFLITAATTVLATVSFAVDAAAQQVTVFSDNFEGGALSAAKWQTVTGNYGTGGVYNGGATYASYFPSNTIYFRSSSGTRAGRTATMSLARSDTTNSRAQLFFDLRYQNGSGTGSANTGLPFDELDAATENIVLEYTLDGSAYTTLQTFAYNNGAYRNGFVTVTVNLPSATWASGANVSFRWRQLGFTTGSDIYDNWAIDNVRIVTNPEPGTLALFGIGAAGLAVRISRRRARAGARAAGQDPVRAAG